MAWGDLAIRIRIEGAQFGGAVVDGGMVIETHDIEYVEGRMPSQVDDSFEGGGTKHLGFIMSFGTINAAVPDCGVAVEARIVISGHATEGFVEIRGDGWFGYDENGNIEGRFDNPPVILVRETVPDLAVERPELTDSDWQEHISRVTPKTSEQFEWAGRGRSISEGDEGA